MGVLDAVTVAFVAPAALVLALGLFFRAAGGKLSWLMLIMGAGCMAPAWVFQLLLLDPGVTRNAGPGIGGKVALLNYAVLGTLIEELLKVGVIYRLLSKAAGLSWRRFAILAAWTGVGFAAMENWLYIAGHGSDVMILRSFSASWLHVLNGIVAARLLWLGAQENSWGMTIAAFCLSTFLHASYNFLALMHKSAGWMFLLALATLAVFAWAALSCRDEPLTKSSI